MPQILALSLRQPWAWAILNAGKDIENRSWPTRHRGLTLIHAAKVMIRREYEEFDDYANTFGRATKKLPEFPDLPRGGIVGQVEIVDCVSSSTSRASVSSP